MFCLFHVLVLTSSRAQGHWTNNIYPDEAGLFSLCHRLQFPPFFGGEADLHSR